MIAKQAMCLIAVACLALPLHAQDYRQSGSQNGPSAQRAEQTAQPTNITITKEGSLPLEQLAGKKVFVAFKNSSKLTDVLMERVARLGGQVVQSAEEADVRLTGEGVFMAGREYGNRRARADVGEVFEKAGQVETKNHAFNIVLASGGPVLSAGQATVVANFAQMIGEATGARSWFNNLVAGDPDGFCFKGCEYKQRATISLEMRGQDETRIGSVSVTAGAEDKKLMPLQIIEAALGAMQGGFDGKGQQPNAGTMATAQ